MTVPDLGKQIAVLIKELIRQTAKLRCDGLPVAEEASAKLQRRV